MLLPKFESLVSTGNQRSYSVIVPIVLQFQFSCYICGGRCTAPLIAGFSVYFLGLIVVCFTAGDNSLAIVRLAATLLGASYGAFGWFFIWDLFS